MKLSRPSFPWPYLPPRSYIFSVLSKPEGKHIENTVEIEYDCCLNWIWLVLKLQGTFFLQKGPDSQPFPWDLYLIEIVEDNVVSLTWKVFNSDNSYIVSCSRIAKKNFWRETTIENNQFSNLWTLISNSYLTRQSFQGYDLNRRRTWNKIYILHGLHII